MWGKHKWSDYSGKTIDGSFYMAVALFAANFGLALFLNSSYLQFVILLFDDTFIVPDLLCGFFARIFLRRFDDAIRQPFEYNFLLLHLLNRAQLLHGDDILN